MIRQLLWAWAPRRAYLWRLNRQHRRPRVFDDRALVESQIRAARLWRYSGR